MRKTIDLTGNRYGRLTVSCFSHYKRSPCGHKNAYWLCKCDCGNTITVPSNRLKSGNTKSCGCLKADTNKRRCTKPYDKRLWAVHNNMMVRCYDSSFKYYEYYGGRGIGICDEWYGKNGVDNFREWAMKNGYKRGLQIDRINNDKGYSPDNCRWVDRLEQGKNKRNNILVTINGETRILAEWCRILNVPYSRVKTRRSHLGWSVAESLLIPSCKGKMTKENRIRNAGLEEVLSSAFSNVD